MGGGPIDAFKMTRIRHGESIGMARGIQEVRTDLTRNARRNDAKRGLEKKVEEQLRRDALEYHRVPTHGKISVTPTKSLVNQRDLALAYSPGVA